MFFWLFVCLFVLFCVVLFCLPGSSKLPFQPPIRGHLTQKGPLNHLKEVTLKNLVVWFCSVCLFGCLIVWLVGCLVGWLVVWLVGWFGLFVVWFGLVWFVCGLVCLWFGLFVVWFVVWFGLVCLWFGLVVVVVVVCLWFGL